LLPENLCNCGELSRDSDFHLRMHQKLFVDRSPSWYGEGRRKGSGGGKAQKAGGREGVGRIPWF